MREDGDPTALLVALRRLESLKHAEARELLDGVAQALCGNMTAPSI
jgi:hypothetical protein